MDPNRPSRSLEKFIIRLPEGMRDRIADAAAHSNQSMNALIVSVLEREFPQPSIDVNQLAAFLNGVAGEDVLEGDKSEYIANLNQYLAMTKDPWTVKVMDGVVKFYPYAARSKDD